MKKIKEIRIVELRDISLAKVDYIGGFQNIGNSYKKLLNWSRANSFTNSKINKTLTIYHDDPNVVGINNVRQSHCVIVDKEIKSSGEIKIIKFTPGKCVVGRYELSYFEFKNAWIEITEWVKSNNLKSSGDSFEVYQNNSNNHSQNKTIIDICIPIE